MPNPIKQILILTFITLFLSACATLNKDECKTANWRVIGYEDGSTGQPASLIGAHRSACAEYGIKPDLDAYNNGRAEGLHQFCIPATGYKKGLSGNSYNGVCAGYKEAQFLSAYNAGKELYNEMSVLRAMEHDFSRQHERQSDLQAELKEKEYLVISGKLSKAKALILLNETKEIAIELGSLTETMHALEGQINKQKQYIANMQGQHRY